MTRSGFMRSLRHYLGTQVSDSLFLVLIFFVVSTWYLITRDWDTWLPFNFQESIVSGLPQEETEMVWESSLLKKTLEISARDVLSIILHVDPNLTIVLSCPWHVQSCNLCLEILYVCVFTCLPCSLAIHPRILNTLENDFSYDYLWFLAKTDCFLLSNLYCFSRSTLEPSSLCR